MSSDDPAARAALVLGANQPPDRFYRGGHRIAAFREEAPSARVPEDWVGSTTALFGEDVLGRTRLPDGRLLVDAVNRNPVAWLGRERVATFGADTGVLVKLLDAGERLPVHAHPDREFAGRCLGLAHGKTEAWIFLEPADVHVGFARPVADRELRQWVASQEVDAMLAAMHTFTPERGEAVLIPAGTPHAIGSGAFIVEVQEPTDLSILMEWRDFAIDGERDGHLGLGFSTALAAVDQAAMDASQVAALRDAATPGALLTGASEFFQVLRVTGDAMLPADFSILVVVAGTGVLSAADGARTDLTEGMTLLCPAAAGPWSVIAGRDLEVLHFRGPAC